MSRVCSTQPRPATRFPVFKGLPTPRSPFRRRWRLPRKEPRRDHGDERLVLNEEGTTRFSNDDGLLAQVQIVQERTVSLLGQKLQGRGLGGRAGSPGAELRRDGQLAAAPTNGSFCERFRMPALTRRLGRG